MIKKPWLIQRVIERPSKNKTKGFDGRFNCDYMGSAEFEFGGLPKSLKEFVKKSNNIVVTKFKKLENDNSQMLCSISAFGEEHAKEYFNNYIELLVFDEINLKESSYFNINTFSKDHQKDLTYYKTDVWWDIENHIMFCYSVDLAKEVIKAIKEVREIKEEQNATDWLQ
jgi:hypothetical protein